MTIEKIARARITGVANFAENEKLVKIDPMTISQEKPEARINIGFGWSSSLLRRSAPSASERTMRISGVRSQAARKVNIVMACSGHQH